jgi:hypothetical protein
MTPGEPAPRVPQVETPGPIAVPRTRYRWYHKLGAFLFIVLALTVGMFLVLYPWTESWEINYFALLPGWNDLWTNLYFRGAVSGVGILNVSLALAETFHLRRFAKR